MLRLRALNNENHEKFSDAYYDKTCKTIAKVLRKAVKNHGYTVEKLTVNRYVTFVAVSAKTSSYCPKNVYSLCENFDYEVHVALSPDGKRPDATRSQRLFTHPLAILGTAVKPTQRTLKPKTKEHEQANPKFPFTPL